MVAAFVIPFGAYLATLTPALTFNDSGEYLATAITLGIPHPSGYPLYVMLAHLFSKLPFFDPAYSVNLFSAVAGALASAVLAWCVWSFTKRWWLALFLPLLLSLSPVFWEQATMAEVNSLNLLFVSLTFALLLRWHATRRLRDLGFASLLAGMAVTAHTMSALFLPAHLLFIVFSRPIIRQWKKTVGVVAACFVLGLLPYLYVPIRSPSAPIRWGTITSPGQIANYVLRGDYRSLSGAEPSLKGGHDAFFLSDFTQYISLFAQKAWSLFGAAGIALAVLGIIARIRKQRAVGLLLLFGILITVPFAAVGGGYPFSAGIASVFEITYLQSSIPVLLAITAGIAAALSWMKKFRPPAARKAIALAVALGPLLPLAGLPATIQTRQPMEPILQTYLENALRQLPDRAVLLADVNGSENLDSITFGLLYLQRARGMRNDVDIVGSTASFATKKYLENYFPVSSAMSDEQLDRLFVSSVIRSGQIEGRPVFSFQPLAGTDMPVARSCGLLYKIFSRGSDIDLRDCPQAPPSIAQISQRLAVPEDSANGRQLFADVYYNRSHYFWERGEKHKAGAALQMAIMLDPYPPSRSFEQFVASRPEVLEHASPW